MCKSIELPAGCHLNSKLRSLKMCDLSNIAGNSHLLHKRAKKFRCRSKRLNRLAIPKFQSQKYSSPLVEPFKFEVKVLSDEKSQIPVRIKMLSYPKVRKLIATREEFAEVVGHEWNNRFKKLIDKSMASLYSRLANVTQTPTARQKKWSREDWDKHKKWLEVKAAPKKTFQPDESEGSHGNKKIPFDELFDAMVKLSKPKVVTSKFRKYCGYRSVVDKNALKYVPTARTLQLAKINPKENLSSYDDPFEVNPNALKANPSKRIIELAKPKSVPSDEPKLPILTPFGVLNRALRAHSSQRVVELAKPREPEDDEDNEPRPNVNPKALKAKPSKRTLELAEPRVHSDL